MTSRTARRARGVTLIELATAVAIIGILATIAVGFGGPLVRRQQFSDLVREVYNALTIARATAVSEGRLCVVTFGAERVTAFVDSSRPPNHVFDSGVDRVIYEFPRAPDSYRPGMSVALVSGFTVVDSETTAVFDSSGFSRDAGGNLTDGQVQVSDAQLGGASRVVTATIGGAMRIQ